MSWTHASQAEGLTPEQLAQLAVLMDRLLPGDARRGIPSASEVGAASFVSRLLGRAPDIYREIPAWRELYPTALSGLDGYAMSQFGRPLTGLTPAEVDGLLAGLQVSGLPGIAAAELDRAAGNVEGSDPVADFIESVRTMDKPVLVARILAGQ